MARKTHKRSRARVRRRYRSNAETPAKKSNTTGLLIAGGLALVGAYFLFGKKASAAEEPKTEPINPGPVTPPPVIAQPPAPRPMVLQISQLKNIDCNTKTAVSPLGTKIKFTTANGCGTVYRDNYPDGPYDVTIGCTASNSPCGGAFGLTALKCSDIHWNGLQGTGPDGTSFMGKPPNGCDSVYKDRAGRSMIVVCTGAPCVQ